MTNNQYAVEEAVAHLGAALIQTIPSDDKIIIDHIRVAHAILRGVVQKLRAERGI